MAMSVDGCNDTNHDKEISCGDEDDDDDSDIDYCYDVCEDDVVAAVVAFVAMPPAGQYPISMNWKIFV